MLKEGGCLNRIPPGVWISFATAWSIPSSSGSRSCRQRVEGAFRALPRHVFVPGVDPEKAYSDEPRIDGVATSSSSCPSLMAQMLELLRLEPGHRVLEIGTGTGYNAALIARLVCPSGRVTTIEVDRAIAEQARRVHAGDVSYVVDWI